MKKAISKYIICFILCILCVLVSIPEKAAAQDKQTIKVGFFAFDGYHMQEDDGTKSGYGYDMLQHLAGYTNWDYEYIGYDKSWSEMLEMLESGEIDMLTSAQKTKDRLKEFDFSEEAIGTSSGILTVRAGDDTYTLEDYENWTGIKVGMIEDNSRNNSFSKFAREKGFSYIPAYYEDTEEMLNDLKVEKKLDAVLTSNLRSIDGEWILAEFDPSPFYIMVKKGNDSLLREINDAIDELDKNESGLREQLMNKYYSPASGEQISFTAEERAYIENMKDQTFVAVVNPDRAPYSYIVNDKQYGITYDISQEIIKRSKLNIVIADTDNSSQYHNMIEEGIADIQFDAEYNYSDAEFNGYRLTVPYIDIEIAKLYKKNTKDFSSVALLRNGDISTRNRDLILNNSESVV